MRKQKAARPVLESMEERLALSAAGGAHPAAEVRSAATALVRAHHAHAATVKHHPTTKATHAVQQPAPKASKSSTKTNSISSFFKSVFPGL